MVKLINSEGVLYTAMKDKWLKVSPAALMGSTDEMRAQRTRYLPKEQLEDEEQYTNRLQHSFLYNMFRDTVEKCVGRPFARDVRVKGISSKLEPLLANADRRGRGLTQVIEQFFKEGVAYGVGHMLVDLPNMQVLHPNPTLADEATLHPYLTNVTPLQIIWWDFDENEDTPVLSEIRIKDTVIKKSKNDPNEQIEYDRISVYTRDSWAIHESTKGSGKFEQTKTGSHSFKQVPLFSWYPAEAIAPMIGKMPLEDLADLNIAHWQSSSQQRNYLRFIRIGVLFISGVSEDDLMSKTDGGQIKLGAQNILAVEDSNAKANYLEHVGTAYGSGQSDLDKLEMQMAALSLQPFAEQASTATGSAIPEAKYQSRLQMWCKLCSEVCTTALRVGSTVAGDIPEKDFAVEIYSDFSISIDNIAKVGNIFQCKREGMMTKVRAFKELQRYGIVDERLDAEEEIAAAEEEASAAAFASLGNMLDPDGNPLDPETDPNAETGKGTLIDGKPPANSKNPAVPQKKVKQKTPFNNPEKQK